MSLPTLTLDINKQQRFNPIKPVLVQGDKGQQLEVVILSNNQDVDLSGCTLKFEATKADNKIIDDDNQSHFIKSENKITYTLVDEAYQSAGVLTGYFRLIDSKGNKDSTPSFEIEVLAQAGSDLRSDNYVSLAQQINDTMLSYQSALKELSDKAPADWQKQQEDFERRFKEFRNQLDQNAANLLTSTDDKFKAKQREIADWFNNAQNDLQSRKTEWDTFKRQSQSEKTAQEQQFRSEFDNLKSDYETKKANLLSDYKKEFDTQKKQLSDDLSNFKSQLKSQLDNTQSTINQLKNSDIPAISKKLDDVRADIEKIDLSSVKKKAEDAYSMADTTSKKVDSFDSRINTKADKSDIDKKADLDYLRSNYLPEKQVYSWRETNNKLDSLKSDMTTYTDQKSLAFKNMAVDEAKQYTDSKSSLEILTEEQAQKMSDSKSAKLGTFYAMNSGGIQGLALGDTDGSFNEIMGYMVALPNGYVFYERNGGTSMISVAPTTFDFSEEIVRAKNGLKFTFTQVVSGSSFSVNPTALKKVLATSTTAKIDSNGSGGVVVSVPKSDIKAGTSVVTASEKYIVFSGDQYAYAKADYPKTTFDFSEKAVTVKTETRSNFYGIVLQRIETY